MDRREHYSNPPLPREETQAVLAHEGRLADPDLWDAIETLVRHSANSLRPAKRRPRRLGEKQIQRRLSFEEVEQLIAQYLAGATVLELAAAHGVHRTTVLTLLERNRVPRRGRIWTPDLMELAIWLYVQGSSRASIGREFKVSPETVRHHLQTAGVPLRQPGRPLPVGTSRPRAVRSDGSPPTRFQ